MFCLFGFVYFVFSIDLSAISPAWFGGRHHLSVLYVDPRASGKNELLMSRFFTFEQ